MQKLEIDAHTQTKELRDLTDVEKQQQALDILQAEKEAEALAKSNAAKLAAVNHAKGLGFTDEMISVMYPNLIG